MLLIISTFILLVIYFSTSRKKYSKNDMIIPSAMIILVSFCLAWTLPNKKHITDVVTKIVPIDTIYNNPIYSILNTKEGRIVVNEKINNQTSVQMYSNTSLRVILTDTPTNYIVVSNYEPATDVWYNLFSFGHSYKKYTLYTQSKNIDYK